MDTQMAANEFFGNMWQWRNEGGEMVSWTIHGVPLRQRIRIPMPCYGIVEIDQLLEVELEGQERLVLKVVSALAPEEDITLFNHASPGAAVALMDLTEDMMQLLLTEAPWRQRGLLQRL